MDQRGEFFTLAVYNVKHDPDRNHSFTQYLQKRLHEEFPNKNEAVLNVVVESVEDCRRQAVEEIQNAAQSRKESKNKRKKKNKKTASKEGESAEGVDNKVTPDSQEDLKLKEEDQSLYNCVRHMQFKQRSFPCIRVNHPKNIIVAGENMGSFGWSS